MPEETEDYLNLDLGEIEQTIISEREQIENGVSDGKDKSGEIS